MREMTKNKQITMTLAILLAIAEALFITVKLSSDGPRNGSARVNVKINERLATLEAVVIPMSDLPQQVAALAEAIKSVQKTQDRIETKVDNHMSGKR